MLGDRGDLHFIYFHFLLLWWSLLKDHMQVLHGRPGAICRASVPEDKVCTHFRRGRSSCLRSSQLLAVLSHAGGDSCKRLAVRVY